MLRRARRARKTGVPEGQHSPMGDWDWARLCGDSPLRLSYVDVREQQIPKLGIFKVVWNALRFRHPLSGLSIGSEVAPNRLASRAPGCFDALSVSGDRQIGRLHRKSRLGLFQHDQESHHLISGLIFFAVSTARPHEVVMSACKPDHVYRQ